MFIEITGDPAGASFSSGGTNNVFGDASQNRSFRLLMEMERCGSAMECNPMD